MSYRPKNWEEIERAQCYDGDCVYRELATFEAGADAMLDALRKDKSLYDLGKVKGTWVFIPDEFEGEK